jgi:acyl-CoA synthetase (AMP-forming)/AMP-acid ligase II
MELLDLVEGAAETAAGIRFTRGNESRFYRYADIWKTSEVAASWFAERFETGQAVAMLLTPSVECVASLLGAWRAGLSAVSLPLPGRAMLAREYHDQVQECCRLAEAETLLLDPDLLPAFAASAIPVVSYGDVVRGGSGRPRGEAGSFVQFTSGSTRRPKGVRLSLSAIRANVDQILEATDLQAGDVVCSWLPLSHDMGLIGCLLTPLLGSSRDRVGSIDVVLMRPEDFVSDPTSWLRAASESRAVGSAMPNLGLELLTRSAQRSQERFDLSSLRILILGAEMVRPTTLRRFGALSERLGFDERMFTPAYGLAEAGLAVSMKPAGHQWRSRRLEDESLGTDSGSSPTGEEAIELTSAGRPLRGTELRVDAAAGQRLGEISVRGPSLMGGYVGAPTPFSDGWLATGDLGALVDGELYVVGRKDDRIHVGGRNLFATELEGTAERSGLVRAGSCAAVPDDSGRYLILAEPVASAELAELRRAALAIRAALANRFRAAPSIVSFVKRGSLPKTPSGKLQRARARHLYLHGRLEVVLEHAVGSPSARRRAMP